jgi:phage shock protein PspC (stress-responsive transcriptional regulator)
MTPKRLYRSPNDRMIAGVCGGLGEYLNVDPTLIRLLWALGSLFLGMGLGGLILYIIAAVVIPEAPA